MITDHELRQYARLGALESVRRILADFPDILPEINRFANARAGLKTERLRTRPLREEVAARIESHVVPALQDDPAPRRRRRSRISRAGRKRISDAMKAMWRKKKGGAR